MRHKTKVFALFSTCVLAALCSARNADIYGTSEGSLSQLEHPDLDFITRIIVDNPMDMLTKPKILNKNGSETHYKVVLRKRRENGRK